MKRSILRALGIVLATVGLWIVWVPLPDRPSGPSTQHNGIWLDRHWLRGSRTPEEMRGILAQLAGARMTYLFIHAGPLQPDGTIPGFDPSRVGLVRQVVKRVDSEFQLVAWVGGLNAARGGNVDLLDPRVRDRIARSAHSLVDAGFDGVQLNLEPTPSGDPGFLLVLDSVRAALPRGVLLGVATNLWGPRWIPVRMLFSHDYLLEIARRVDQIAVMNYDTYAFTPAVYQRVSAAQTQSALRAMAVANPAGMVLIGVPAYPSEGGLRHLHWAENPASALVGIAAGLGRTNQHERELFAGVAVYAGWTASETDWRSLNLWAASQDVVAVPGITAQVSPICADGLAQLRQGTFAEQE